MRPDAPELFALDEALRTEGCEMLQRSGIGAILQGAGFLPVGSQMTHTMTWRDLDFERIQEPPDWQSHWELGQRLAATGWCVRLNCVDSYRSSGGQEPGYYWGLRVIPPARLELSIESDLAWKLDVWTARAHEYEPVPENRRRWAAEMTESKRADILAIKRELWHTAEYRRTVLSVHIYEAVLSGGVDDIAGFWKWWREHTQSA